MFKKSSGVDLKKAKVNDSMVKPTCGRIKKWQNVSKPKNSKNVSEPRNKGLAKEKNQIDNASKMTKVQK